MDILIKQINYKDAQEASDLAYLMDCYSRDPMGNNVPLDESIKNTLGPSLSQIPHAFSVIAYVNNKPAGLINCFENFSTFKCKPLINIHDIVSSKDHRGLQLSQKMLEKVQQIALDRGCCKMTLEVLEGNKIAQNAYRKFGFGAYELDPAMGSAQFWQKEL